MQNRKLRIVYSIYYAIIKGEVEISLNCLGIEYHSVQLYIFFFFNI